MTLELYWLQNCPYYDSTVEIYDRKMFIRLATEIIPKDPMIGPYNDGYFT